MKKAQAELIRQSKPQVIEKNKEIYGQGFQVRKVRLANLKVENSDFYAEVRSQLERLGFAWCADIRIVSFPKGGSGYRTPISLFLGKDNETYCAIYSVQLSNEEKMQRLMAGSMAPLNIIDVTSRIDKGKYLVTTNAEDTRLMTRPKRIDSHIMKLKTKVPGVVKAHRNRVRRIRLSGKKLAEVGSFEAIIENEKAMHQIKTEFQEKRGWTSTAELKRFDDDLMGKEDGFAKLLESFEKALGLQRK